MKLRHWMTSFALAVPLALFARLALARVGAAAPAFTLPAVEGTASLAALKGKVVYVDFWASWCDPCRRSFPFLKSMQEKYGPQGLVVVAIDLDKRRADADAFLRKYPAPFTVAFDPTGRVAEAFQVAAMPSSFLIGADGAILHQQTGFDLKQSAAIESRIAEACAR